MAYETFLDREPVFTGLDLAAYLEGRGLGWPRLEAQLWWSGGRRPGGSWR